MEKMKKTLITLMTILAVIPAFSQSKTVKALAEGKTQTIVFYGASIFKNTGGKIMVKRVVDNLAKDYAGKVEVFNSGSISKNSKWGVENLQDSVLARKPDMVLMEWATNDAVTRLKTSPEQSRQNATDMVSRIKEANPDCDIYIVVCTGHPLGEGAEKRPNIDAYNDIYRAVAKEQKVNLIDIAPIYKELYDKLGEETFKLYTGDGIHCTRKGAYFIFAPKILAAITGDPKHKTKF